MPNTRTWIALALVAASIGGCESGPSDPGGRPVDGGGPPSGICGSVRLTSYDVFARGWCEFDTDYSFLPTFVRNGLTAAIAEPYNGGSYQGDPGEGCGECWEIDSIHDTRIVMIADLCPIQGNPLCAGGQFHIDLARPASDVLQAGFLDEGAARRVPCPVSGDVHLLVNDENFSYMRVQFLNHRIPVRAAEWQATGAGVNVDNPWTPVTRSGGAWEVIGGSTPIARGGTGVVFRLTSAQGQTIESTVAVPTHPAHGSTFDLGVQFDDIGSDTGGSCVFVPPAEVFVEDWGGIDEVRWMIDPWGAAENGPFGPVNSNCYGGSNTCLFVRDLDQWTGFHLYYRQAFPTSTFSSVTLRARTASGSGMIQVAAGYEGTRCTGMTYAINETYTDITIDLTSTCGSLDQLNQITVDNPGSDIGLYLDDVVFH